MSAKKLALLTLLPEIYSNRRLIEEGKLLNLEITSIDFLQDSALNDSVDFNGVIPRIGVFGQYYGLNLVKKFEYRKIPCLNGLHALSLSKDKWHSLQELALHDLPIPKTTLGIHCSRKLPLPEKFPVVLKTHYGSQGRGIYLAKNHHEFKHLLKNSDLANGPYLIQEFIEESKGEDLRLFVVGNSVVATIIRNSTNNDFRSNLHLGGDAKMFTPSPEIKDLAVKAVQAIKADVAGVDIILSKKGPLILEVNTCPGLQGIEKATGINVAREMLKKLLEKLN